MWAMEYEVDALQSKFSESIGTLDLDNIDVDFIEDMMLKSKPLQGILNDIRVRQNQKLDEVKKTYGEAIKDLEALIVERPEKGIGEEEPAKDEQGPAPVTEGEAPKAEESVPPPAETSEAPPAEAAA